jgi:hypothetical protein
MAKTNKPAHPSWCDQMNHIKAADTHMSQVFTARGEDGQVSVSLKQDRFDILPHVIVLTAGTDDGMVELTLHEASILNGGLTSLLMHVLD